jgi:hypothetical protein
MEIAGQDRTKMRTSQHNALTLLEFEPDGPMLGSDQDASDVLGEAFAADADVVVIPVERLDPAFFELRSGLAGGFFQKLQNYQCRLVVLGDVSALTAQSRSLHDFVYETNRRGQHLFAPNRQAMLERLGSD